MARDRNRRGSDGGAPTRGIAGAGSSPVAPRLATLLALAPLPLQGPGGLPLVPLDRDDIVVRESCVLDPTGLPIADLNGDGVVHVVGDGVTVVFVNKPLSGAPAGSAPDGFTGTGVRISGRDVTLRGAVISGYKCGIRASGADGLVLEGCDVSGNFAQRLRSTPAAEDASDWLWPHENDSNEWLERYGAGIYVEESGGVTLRSNRARGTQNGICLRRVDDSRIYDNDMSWLSGWGLALYRSSRNTVCRNSFDFCIRGYSHGAYSRGQDSAGILCFEQCSDNVFAFNSATHGGDGFFGFAGTEALEGTDVAGGVGCNRNLLYANDFSDAAAIGIELTFSFDGIFARNRLVGCNYGVWGGYSSRMQLRGNEIADNALAGVAVEHGSDWLIAGNSFARNARAIELWWDDDADLLAKPWAARNPTVSAGHQIRLNRFEGDRVQLELRGPSESIRFDPAQPGFDRGLWKVEPGVEVDLGAFAPAPLTRIDEAALAALPGSRQAVGARAHLAGRERIVMTEWGPYDWISPYLQRVEDRDGMHVWRLLGNDIPISVDAGPEIRVSMDASVDPPLLLLAPRRAGEAVAYELSVRMPATTLRRRATLVDARWSVVVGKYATDPREDAAAWRAEVERGVRFESRSLAFRYQGGGPSELAGLPPVVLEASLGRDRFGTLASTSVRLPAGAWAIASTSDDGVRVRVDGKLVIDNWTHHGPTVDRARLEFDAAGEHSIEVEHFELDGWAVLELGIEPAD